MFSPINHKTKNSLRFPFSVWILHRNTLLIFKSHLKLGEKMEVSGLDIQNDIKAALDINEVLYGDTKEFDSQSLAMVCEIRARLKQALEKTTQMFECNLELLATITQLRKDNAILEFKNKGHITVR